MSDKKKKGFFFQLLIKKRDSFLALDENLIQFLILFLINNYVNNKGFYRIALFLKMKNRTIDEFLYVLNFYKDKFMFFFDVIFNFYKKKFVF